MSERFSEFDGHHAAPEQMDDEGPNLQPRSMNHPQLYMEYNEGAFSGNQGMNQPPGIAMQVLLTQWEENYQTTSYNPEPTLKKMAELIEYETEAFMKHDPDPFDERHPSRVDPNGHLGHSLRVLFRRDTFMNKLINDYLAERYWRLHNSDRSTFDINVAAARLFLDVMPGLDLAAIFNETTTSLISRLFSWAESAAEPLQTYAVGMIAAAMTINQVFGNFREENARLIPIVMQRLHKLMREPSTGNTSNEVAPEELTNTGLNKSDDSLQGKHVKSRFILPESPLMPNNTSSEIASDESGITKFPSAWLSHKSGTFACQGGSESGPTSMIESPAVVSSLLKSPPVSCEKEYSNSSWAEMECFVIGLFQMYPLTVHTKQIFMLRYLRPVSEYSEYLAHAFEQNAMQLILHYTNLDKSRDARVAFEALKYLSSLLLFQKFAFDFINVDNIQHLMDIRRPSIAACAVSLCMFHIAYSVEALERVCLLPHYIIHQVVRYALWLLECSHDSSRCNAVNFFTGALSFQVFLEEFDLQDGLRKVYNVVATQPLVASEEEPEFNEDEKCAQRMIIRLCFTCLRTYFVTHLAIKTERMRSLTARNELMAQRLAGLLLPPVKVQPFKTIKVTPEEIQDMIDALLRMMSVNAHWIPVENFIHLGGIPLFLKIMALQYDWNHPGRVEIVRCALDSIAVCCVLPKAQLQLCEIVDLPSEPEPIAMGMGLILGAADGEIVADEDVQRAALRVIGACVCAPQHRVGFENEFNEATPMKRQIMKNSEDIIDKLWDSVRFNNGIMLLLNLMTMKIRVTEADSIRMLACRALAGLARSDTVCQILSKLPIITSGQLQLLMRNPILQDRWQEHVQFQKYAIQLLERVSGKTGACNELEASLADIHKAGVVAQTKIQYNDKQLFQLIHKHLISKGLVQSAHALQVEADLPEKPPTDFSMARPGPPSPFLYVGNSRSPFSTPSRFKHPSVYSGGSRTKQLEGGSSSVGARMKQMESWALPEDGKPLKLIWNKRYDEYGESKIPPTMGLQKQPFCDVDIYPMESEITMDLHDENPTVSLDEMVVSYLKNQHSLCKKPVATCPAFNLFRPHKCPEPVDVGQYTTNVVRRLCQRSVHPPRGGPHCVKQDRHLIYSRICQVKTFRYDNEENSGGLSFSCVAFEPNDRHLLAGTEGGEIVHYSVSGEELGSYQCLESYIYHMEPSRDGRLLLTCTTWNSPSSALFDLKDFQLKWSFHPEEYVEFSKLAQNRIVGSTQEVASIYDVETGRKLMTLRPDIFNNYLKNRATFNHTDELILSDGVLWDVDSGKAIHKFDKLNDSISGTFHPNGLEVVANSEVWDLRTFHLLHTVRELDQCYIAFTPHKDVIYCTQLPGGANGDEFEDSFKFIDATDYSSIATMDVKRHVYDLKVNNIGTQLAVVENAGSFRKVSESVIRLYDIGRLRDIESEDMDENESVASDKFLDISESDSDDSATIFTSDLSGRAAEDLFREFLNSSESQDGSAYEPGRRQQQLEDRNNAGVGDMFAGEVEHVVDDDDEWTSIDSASSGEESGASSSHGDGFSRLFQ